MKKFDYIVTGSGEFEVAYLKWTGEWMPQSTWSTKAAALRWIHLAELVIRIGRGRN